MSECFDTAINVKGHATCLRVLTEARVPDRHVMNVVLSFKSKKGRTYTAVHVFKHPMGQHILLISKDKDREDFIEVASLIAKAYRGTVDGNILNRGKENTAGTIDIGQRWFSWSFSQSRIRKQFFDFFRQNFSEARFTLIDYDDLQEKHRRKILALSSC